MMIKALVRLRSFVHSAKAMFSNDCKESLMKLESEVTINYLRIGKGDKTVLCLPGALGTIWSDFKPQIEKFNREKFSLVVWDPPGYGKSKLFPRTFEGDFFARDAHHACKLMEALNITRYSVLGWSDGGITGLILASKNPKAVEDLVIWGANSYVTKEDLKLYEGIRDTSKWSEKMRKPLEETYGSDQLQKMMTDWCEAMEAYYTKGGEIISQEDLHKITSRVLILHGDKDPLVPDEHPVFILEHIKGSKIHRFPDGKHNIHLKYAEDFNKIVQDFLLSSS